MRFAVFVSSIIIALYPSLVFANLPAPTGVVLDTYQKKDGTWHARLPSSYKGTLGKAGGLIKGVPRVAGHPVVVGGSLVVGGLAAWCKANKRKCAEKVGEDVVCVIVGEDCEDDKDDICRFAWSITHYDPSRSDRDTTYNKHLDIYPKIINPNYLIKPHDDADDFMKDYENNSQKSYDGEWHTISNISIPIFIKFNDLSIEYYQSYGIFDMHYKCDGEYDEDDKQKDLLDALKKLHDSLEDDEIKNIVNNYYGDDIDIEKQCNGAYSCTTINEGDDNDTTNNTTNNDNDTTNNTTKKEDEDTTNNTKGKGDEDELECNDTDLSKAVCKIIDWLDDEAEDPDDQKAKIKDEDYDDDLDDDTINVSKGCPSNQTISYSMMGFGASIELPYHSICKFAQMVNPYVTASGAIVSFYIITGNRQS